MSMSENDHVITSAPMKLESDGEYELGVYKPGFQFKEEALNYFRLCVGKEVYERAMNSEVGRQHYYVPVRAFLSQADWEKFVWIEQYGSLDGFPGCG